MKVPIWIVEIFFGIGCLAAFGLLVWMTGEIWLRGLDVWAKWRRIQGPLIDAYFEVKQKQRLERLRNSAMLKAAVEQVLTEARADAAALNDAINWGDLRCVNAQRLDDGSWFVEIEEVSPDASAFQAYIANRLVTKDGLCQGCG
ncbi:MAG: hypothetical protein OWQ57_02010 [Sulfobacillus sp.]|nr:hypothetical protein [Sulfobacillus sp.]